MENYAGMSDKDTEIEAELVEAGINVSTYEFLRNRGEVKTSVIGGLHGWDFERAWKYWIAKGPGIPCEVAEELHKTHGKVVRVAGHCMCPSPTEWYKGFGVGLYHVDTQEGLNALAETIRSVVKGDER